MFTVQAELGLTKSTNEAEVEEAGDLGPPPVKDVGHLSICKVHSLHAWDNIVVIYGDRINSRWWGSLEM